jgi:uncharacterized protein YjbI with pentapeptide repeats
MTDAVRAGSEGETPVNPYSLLEAVNAASDTANTAWLIFLAIMAYFTIAVAGVSHKDLMLETPVALPIMQVSVQQSLFFQFAPVILVLFHLGVVAQLVLLARKTLEFDYAVRALEMTDRRNHPLRLELHNFFFVQAVAGPHRSAVMGTFLHGMSWLTLVVLPVVLLLFIQLAYLPYHDVDVTWTHRICVVLDIAMLVLIGVFLMRIETSFFSAFWRTTISSPVSFLVTTGLLLVVLFFSFLVATVPGEALDRLTQALTRSDRRADSFRSARLSSGFALPFVHARSDGTLLGRFHRNLVVMDQDLAPKRAYVEDETSISLRGRDLRFARLDRSDLRRADLTGADLEGASLVGTDLTEARLACADLSELILSEDRLKARCVRANGAVLTRAKLIGARLSGIDLRGARLEEAQLTGAEMSYALATGANFSSAQMERVEMGGGVQLQGANMLVASLQGANLFGALMQGADLSSASLQGAILTHAHLQGAVLRDADLEGADMQYASLQRADLSGAKVRAADLRGATIWQTGPPMRDSLPLADLSGLVVRAIDPEEAKMVRTSIDRIEDESTKRQVLEVLEPLFNTAAGASWGTGSDRQLWQSYVTVTQAAPQETYAKDLTDHLASLMCKSRFASGAVANGIAQRSLGVMFRGSLATIYERLRGKDCPASGVMPAKLMQRMSATVDTAAGK